MCYNDWRTSKTGRFARPNNAESSRLRPFCLRAARACLVETVYLLSPLPPFLFLQARTHHLSLNSLANSHITRFRVCDQLFSGSWKISRIHHPRYLLLLIYIISQKCIILHSSAFNTAAKKKNNRVFKFYHIFVPPFSSNWKKRTVHFPWRWDQLL